jgi:hypothetical protein
MIGDWVQNETGSIKGRIVNIDTYQNRVEFGAHTIDTEYVYPIPLTPEILEKNSFLKVESIVYDAPRIGVSYLYRITPEGLRIFVQNACVGGPTCTMIKTCKYVHEVQHMIKMCDIEKTFVL